MKFINYLPLFLGAGVKMTHSHIKKLVSLYKQNDAARQRNPLYNRRAVQVLNRYGSIKAGSK